MKDREAVRWIRRHCGKRGAECAVLVALNAYSAVCVTLFALLSKAVIDCAQRGDGEGFLRWAVLFLLLIVSQMASRAVSAVVEAMSRGKAEMCLKTHIFSNLIYGEYASVKKRHSGELSARLSADVGVVSDTAVHLLPAVTAYIIRIIGAGAALFAMDKRFAFAFLLCAVLVALFAALIRKPLKSIHSSVQEKDAGVRSYMQEMAENLFAVKIFKIEDKVIEKSKLLQKTLYKAKVQKQSFSAAASIGFSLAFGVGFLAAVVYGASGILKGTLTFGTVTAVIQLVNQLQAPTSGITGVLPSFFSMTASASRLMELECGKEENPDINLKYDDFVKIQASNLSFAYDDGEAVIKNSSFEIAKGDFAVICGESGAGKTTLFKLITGLYTPDEGKVEVIMNDRAVSGTCCRELFSYVPQGNMLFSGTIRENLTILNPEAGDGEIEAALKTACADFVWDLPEKTEFVLGESGAGLSEGQAQRIAIARALLGKGKILLMDEATSALDPETEKRLLSNLKSLGDITLVFITHREAVLKESNKILRAENGSIQ